MKTSIRFSIIAFVLVLVTMATVQNARSVGEEKGESEKVIIEVDKLGKELGVQEEETVMPDGSKMMGQKWGQAEIQKAVAELPKRYNDPEKSYLVTSSPHPAITLAFNYIEDTQSISIARHEDDYTCAVSFSDDIEVGEVTVRTLPNDL